MTNFEKVVHVGLSGAVTPRLSGLSTHFGERPDILEDGIEIRIGSEPECLDLLAILARKGLTPSPEVAEIAQYRRVWLCRFTLSMRRNKSAAKCRSIGLSLSFPKLSGVGVQEMLPQTEFIDLAVIDSEGKMRCRAEVDISGHTNSFAESAPGVPNMLPGKLGGELSADIRSTGSVKIEFKVQAAKVESIGTGDRYCRWKLLARNGRLEGDHVFYATIRVPANRVGVRCTAKAYAELRCNLFDYVECSSKAVPFNLEFGRNSSISNLDELDV